ncbi:PIN domain-containing protein [Candidatus Amesbacteria bacterium]|nr:PIN domain-containing protein [Candidatus Amesbacteria bacterium]MBI2587586.1 PIN domain-containing protein [Candidatus Amesbacteria bacterium]
MEKSPRLFVDSNVIVSCVRSQTGASYIVLHELSFRCHTSNECQKEIQEISTKQLLNPALVKRTISKLTVVNLKLSDAEILRRFGKYVTDLDDAHVIAGAKQVRAKFLLTHNLKHFQIDKIKKNLNIEVITPGRFVQSLRNS